MSTSAGSLSLDAARQSMDVLARHLDAFVEAWEAATGPPDLKPFLPEAGEIRRLTLVELIKVDLEYRWLSRNCPKRLFAYIDEFPELGQARVPCDLIYEEFHIRKQSGEEVSAEEYLQAFPGQTAEIASILGIERAYETSSFYHRHKEQRIEGIAAGDTIDDFDLLAELGAGAFAKVFLARQKSMQRLVALKVSSDQGTEPQTLAQLDHDHIVRVFDQRLIPERKLRLLYMQYVAGGTLQAVVQRVRQTPPEKRTGKLLLDAVDEILERRGESRPVESSLRQWLSTTTWPEAVCWLGTRLARALDYAHSMGVLHRDVKPANVLITGEPSPKLADFNISFSDKVDGATPAAYFGGSLAYMSPEQLEACNPAHARTADELDGRSDLYALGMVLWELLTGFRPFADEDVKGGWSATLESMAALRKKGVDANDLLHFTGCPAGLPSVMQVTLDPDRECRWQSGHEMARRLELCTNPKACALLFPSQRSFQVRSRRFAVLIIFVMAGLPNVLAGTFNSIHNEMEIIPRLAQHSSAFREVFERTRLVVNFALYPVGAFLFWYVGFSVYRGLKKCQAHEPTSPRIQALRRRCLQLGHLVAAITIVEWALAAAIYPTSLRLFAGAMPLTARLHFFFSLLLCGFVAAAYPFFGITFYALRSLYPVFLLHDLNGASRDSRVIKRIGRWSWIYLLVAAVAPLLSIAALIVDNQFETRFDLLEGRAAELSMGVFSAVGLLGLPPIFRLFHSIQSDLQTISGIISTRPASEIPMGRSGPFSLSGDSDQRSA